MEAHCHYENLVPVIKILLTRCYCRRVSTAVMLPRRKQTVTTSMILVRTLRGLVGEFTDRPLDASYPAT